MIGLDIRHAGGQLKYSFPLGLRVFGQHERQLEKEVNDYARELGFSSSSILVEPDGYGSIDFFINSAWCSDRGHFDGDDAIIFVVTMYKLFDDPCWEKLPLLESLLTIKVWNEEGVNLHEQASDQEYVEAIKRYPEMLDVALYDFTGPNVLNDMVSEFKRCLDREPTEDELNDLNSVIVYRKLLQS